MCIRVCIHRTTAAHDKRFHAVLNPATGYTVLSPFQDPIISSCESSPCIEIKSPQTSHYCPWHAGCCNFDKYDLSCNAPQKCTSKINYHHFLRKEAPNFSVASLRPYTIDPVFPSLIARFFKAGVELNLALTKLPELKASLDKLPILSNDVAVEKAKIASRWYHYQHIKLLSMAFMAQMAIYWDAKVDQKLWPPRPGREVFPELNCFNESDAYLQVVSMGKMDFDPRGEWPHIFTQWPNFGESLSFGNENLHHIPWMLDAESGTWKSITDVSWGYKVQIGGSRSQEVVSVRTEQPEPRESESEHDEQEEEENDKPHISEPIDIDSIQPLTPIALPPEFNNPSTRARRRNLSSRYLDRRRGYRHMRRSSRATMSRSNLKRRSSKKQVTSGGPIKLSLDSEGRWVSSIPPEIADTASAVVEAEV
ncbi:hypothetical protein F4679DRAFT_563682 [Xylaria curta]|nr:hypothetical protein F4679DRAFT_563682 [Xylaria curta]